MASPVNTSVKHFVSDQMAGAPALSGTAGAMIGVLDACLVNGFDLKTLVSLAVAGGVATATWTGTHSATPDSVVLIDGVTGALTALNGEQKVIATTATTLTFATAAADGTASGTITMKMAPAGWEKVYTGTNKAVYRALDVAGTRMYLRVDDTNTTFSRVVGYETMSDVDTGAGPFPTAAQISGGGYWIKSSAANATANKWALCADTRFFYWHPMPHVNTNPLAQNGITRGFGDPNALNPGGDAYACVLNYAASASYSDQNGQFDNPTASAYNAMPRDYTGVGSSALHLTLPYTGGTTLSGNDGTFGTFPSEVDGSLILSRRYITVAAGRPPRANLPGLLHVPQSGAWNSFKMADKADGTGALAGRKLLALSPSSSIGNTSAAANTGVSFVDITGPWR